MILTQIQQLDRTSSPHRQLVREELFKFMADVFGRFYPRFDSWYLGKVVPGFAHGERIIHIVSKNGSIYGVAITKVGHLWATHDKLCSFFVLPELRKSGFGTQLLSAAVATASASCRPIIITVPEEKMKEGINRHEFEDFLVAHGFELLARQANRYREGKYEYVFIRPSLSGIWQQEPSFGSIYTKVYWLLSCPNRTGKALPTSTKNTCLLAWNRDYFPSLTVHSYTDYCLSRSMLTNANSGCVGLPVEYEGPVPPIDDYLNFTYQYPELTVTKTHSYKTKCFDLIFPNGAML